MSFSIILHTLIYSVLVVIGNNISINDSGQTEERNKCKGRDLACSSKNRTKRSLTSSVESLNDGEEVTECSTFKANNSDLIYKVDILHNRVNTNYLTLIEVMKRLNTISLSSICPPVLSSSNAIDSHDVRHADKVPVSSVDDSHQVSYHQLDDVVAVLSNEVLRMQDNTEAMRMQTIRSRETLEKRIQELELFATSNKQLMQTDGKFKWAMKNCLSVFALHRTTTDVDKMSIVSQRFQTPSGHEFRLRLFMNGSGRGKNTHMSLFVQMCKTDFDTTLVYPFVGVLKFRMLDQAQGRPKQHWDQRFKTNASACFQMPEGQFCPENGLAQFISHEMLMKNSGMNDDGHSPIYMHNEVMFMEVTIEAAPGFI